jgi:hypothetical protein
VEATLVKDESGKRIPHPDSLYNLAEDRMEQNNLIKTYPEKAKQLKTKLDLLKKGEGLRAILR